MFWHVLLLATFLQLSELSEVTNMVWLTWLKRLVPTRNPGRFLTADNRHATEPCGIHVVWCRLSLGYVFT